jgi:glycyl-tRNA synthetase beta chain
MPDLLLEIGSEELPPKDIAPALRQLTDDVRATLADLRIDAGPIHTYGTPRRLALVCLRVASHQRPVVREVRGPAAQVAFNAHNHPTPAALGFARAQGVPVQRLQVREVEGKRYTVAVVAERGKPSAQVLAAALADAVARLSFPKTMRWGQGDARFARPIRWLVALLGSAVLPVEVAGVRAGRTTLGHRALSRGTHPVPSAQAYLKVLTSSGVIAEPDKRRQTIMRQATALAAQVNGSAVIDPSLLDELVMSTEHPHALRGAFDREFLALPSPVLVTVMQHHQKYLPIEDSHRHLLPYFITVRDGDNTQLAMVRQGHEWVLRGRLADATFFFKEDRKHRLEDYLPRLEGVVFQAQLGTMAEKTRRVVTLVRQVSALLLLDGHTTEALLRAATLCKADLVTHMVGEFPELQGVMGQIYAELDGESPEVARAIGEHYRPTTATDSAPRTQGGALLGLVDAVDTLVGALAAGLTPTGSQDPYGLRRIAQAIVEITQMLRLRLPLRRLTEAAAAGYGKTPRPELISSVVEFVRQRLRVMLIDRGIRYDLVDAALAVSEDDLLAAANRAQALQTFASRPEFARLYVAYDRASRILSAEVAPQVDPGKFEVPAERQLHDAVVTVAPKVRAAAAAGDYLHAMEELLPLTAPVDRIFDDVLIMAPDPGVRANRLALLRLAADVFRVVADFAKVVMAEPHVESVRGQRGTAPAKTK